MLQLIIILLYLSGLGFCCVKFSKGAIVSPQLGFAVCFIPQVLYAFFFVKYWSLDLSVKTVLTVIGGCTLFVITSFFTSWLIDRKKSNIRLFKSLDNNTGTAIVCTKHHLVAFAALQLIAFVWAIVFLLKLYGGTNLSAAIVHFNDTNKFSEKLIRLPSILGKLRILSIASGYIWSYLLIHSIVHKYKSEYALLGVNIFLSVLNCVITGSRTEAFQLFIAVLIQIYLIYGRKNGWRSIRISSKAGGIICGGLLAAVLSFQALGNLLGRGSKIGMWEYIGIYLSAELKNLDTFIRVGSFGAPIGKWQTLIEVVNIIARRCGIPQWVHKFDIPFEKVNGHSLGNVKTTFYAWLYDGGYLGVIIFVIIMAVICQMVFLLATRGGKRQDKISISEIVYSYMFFTIIFSFFSNKFYEHIFSGQFVFLVLFWYLIKCYVELFSIENCKRLYNKVRRK